MNKNVHTRQRGQNDLVSSNTASLQLWGLQEEWHIIINVRYASDWIAWGQLVRRIKSAAAPSGREARRFSMAVGTTHQRARHRLSDDLRNSPNAGHYPAH